MAESAAKSGMFVKDAVEPAKDKAKQPIDSKGLPIHTYNVPGLSRKAGTPGWVSGPAKAAARKGK